MTRWVRTSTRGLEGTTCSTSTTPSSLTAMRSHTTTHFSTNRISGEKMSRVHWRGIYQYFYNTDAPHTRPWEMLGHSEKPTTLGRHIRHVAPYTSGNDVLWNAIATQPGHLWQTIYQHLPTGRRFREPSIGSFIGWTCRTILTYPEGHCLGSLVIKLRQRRHGGDQVLIHSL